MKSKIMGIIRFFLILVILTCISILGKRLLDYRTNAKNNKHIENIVNEVENEVDTNGQNKNINATNEDPYEKKKESLLKIVQKLKSENDDVVGFIEIPDIGIAYPVLQGPDNEYYLRKGLNQQYDIAGSLFIDVNNDPEFNDDNTIIYGHHLEINSMFTPLDQYRKQEFAEKHTTIYLATTNELREYKVFSAYGIPSDYDYRTLYFPNRSDVVPYFNKLRSKSEVLLPSKDFTEDDKVLTLSTCQYDYEDQRLALHAYRVK